MAMTFTVIGSVVALFAMTAATRYARRAIRRYRVRRLLRGWAALDRRK
jgi:RNase P protein component